MKPTPTDLAQRIANLSPDQRRVLESRLQAQIGASPQASVIARRSPTEPTLLSYGQQRLWFLDQLQPGLIAYNTVSAFRLRGVLSQSALQQSLDEIVRRHESLRTTFVLGDGQPRQVIHPTMGFPLTVEDLDGLPVERWQAEIKRCVAAEENRLFDLTQDLMRRALLLRFGEQEHVLILASHHIASDAWSSGVFWRELTALYAAFVAGKSAELPPLPIQYADYAQWQRQWLQSGPAQAQLAYWRQHLAGAPQVLELPTDRPRPPAQSFRGAEQSVMLPHTLLVALKGLGRSADATIFMTLLTGFKILLHRYTGQDDLVVGAPTAGRVRPELEGLIGFFINNLVLRTQITATLTVREALTRVRSNALSAYANQDVPFEVVLDALQPERSLSHMPLFQAMFSLQNTPRREYHLSGLVVEHLPSESHSAKFDLAIDLIEQDDGLRCTVEYSTDLFDSATIARMIGHYQTVLTAMVDHPEGQVATLPLLTATERDQLLDDWRGAGANYPQDRCIHELFEVQAQRTPDALAVVGSSWSLTYSQLNERANQLAHLLRNRGVGPEVTVGVLLERSPNLIVAILAVLKAGGAYVPIDPAYPAERVAFMLVDTAASVVIAEQALGDRLADTPVPVVWLDAAASVLDRQPTWSPNIDLSTHHAAYIIYTSGSTGHPKGVVVSHANVTRLFCTTTELFNFTSADVWTLFHSHAFDFSVWEMWGALLYGGRLVIVPYEVSRSPHSFYRLLCQHGVTILNQTPSAFRQLIQAESDLGVDPSLALRTVVFGGEALTPADLRPWYERHRDRSPQLVNMYGITETTVHVTYQPLTSTMLESETGSPIGAPLPDMQAIVLDQNRQLVPIGVPGVLYVGGDGVARGYHNRPELTSERFIDNPFQPGTRLYNSGDRVRWRTDGTLDYLGRVDNQVKIRGYRIELGEVETRLKQHPAVADCVVVVRKGRSGDKRLVAYWVARSFGKATVPDLLAHMRNLLPEYMTPAIYVQLDVLPLTPNGKIDQRALPEADGEYHELGATIVAPRSSLEQALVDIWCEVLERKQVDIRDNFFDLGGHSLLVTQVISRIRKGFKVELPVRTVFERPTVAELAVAVATLISAEPIRLQVNSHQNAPSDPEHAIEEFVL